MNFRRMLLWLVVFTLVLGLTAAFFAVTFTGDKLYGAEGRIVYVGETSWGKPHGQGVLRDKSGAVIYRGEWKKGFPHGQGISYTNASDYYDGQWSQGLPSGHGSLALTKSRGSSVTMVWYVGDWQQGLPDGSGHYYGGSYRYDGEWKEGFPNGQGMLFYPKPNSNWIFYEGDIVQGVPQGYGHFTLSDREYKGNVAEGVPAGAGNEYSRESILLFNGSFQGGVRHGDGEELPGHPGLDSFYDGNWFNGSRHGTGSEFFPDSGTLAFAGQWIADMYHQGQGYKKSGQEQSGNYLENYNWLIQNSLSVAVVSNANNALRYSRAALSLEKFRDVLPDSEKRFLIGLLLELPETYSTNEVKDVLRAINGVPAEHLYSLVKWGFKIRLVNGLVTDEPELAVLRNEESERGIPYKDSLGVASYSDQLLVIRLSFPGISPSTALHEIGHGIDYISGIDSISNSYFNGLRAEEAGKVFDRDYYIDYPEEYFAQFYAQMYIGRQTVASRYAGEQLRLRAPKTLSYLEGAFDRFEPYKIYEPAPGFELNPLSDDKSSLHPTEVAAWVAENYSGFTKIFVRPSAFSPEELMEAWSEAEIVTWLQQERFGFFYEPGTSNLSWRHSAFPAKHYLVLALDGQGDWYFGEIAADLEYYRLPEGFPMKWSEEVKFSGNWLQTFIWKVRNAAGW